MLVHMKFFTGKDALLAKDLLGKAATIKRFEYSQLTIFTNWHCKKAIPRTRRGIWA